MRAVRRRAMLAGLRAMHKFKVVDPGNPGGGIGSGHGDGIELETPRRAMPQGFPPVTLYQLSSRIGTGVVELTAEPEPLGWYRIVVEPGQSVKWPAYLDRGEKTDQLRYRFSFLARLGELPAETVRKLFRAESKVEYRAPVEAAAGIERLLGAKQRDRTDLARITIRIEPTVYDLRTSRGLPLAPVCPRDLALELE